MKKYYLEGVQHELFDLQLEEDEVLDLLQYMNLQPAVLVELRKLRNEQDDDDDDDDDDDQSSVASQSSAQRQLPGRKRKRRQSVKEKEEKSQAKRQRQEASSSRSLKHCPTCVKEGRFDDAATYSRISSPRCPFHRRRRLQMIREEHGKTIKVTRKIGLEALLNLNQNDSNTLVNSINVVVSYVRDIIIESHLFINYYIYYHLNTNQPISKVVFTQSFFHSVFQLIVGRQVTVNNTIKLAFSQELTQIFNMYTNDFNGTLVEPIHGHTIYGHIMATVTNDYATKFSNRIVEDFTQWLANYISLKLREYVQDPTFRKTDADKLSSYILEIVANNDDFPPEFPSILSDFTDTDQINECINRLIDDVEVDLEILFILSDIQNFYNSHCKSMEHINRILINSLVNPASGLRQIITINGINQIAIIKNLYVTTNDQQHLMNIASFTQTTLNALRLYQEVYTTLQIVSHTLGLESHLLVDQDWTPENITESIESLERTTPAITNYFQEHDIQIAPDQPTEQHVNAIIHACNLTRPFANTLNDQLHQYHTIDVQMRLALQQFYNNYTFGNVNVPINNNGPNNNNNNNNNDPNNDNNDNEDNALFTFISRCAERDGVPGYGENDGHLGRRSLTTAFIAKHTDLFLKYSFNIAIYLENFNNEQLNVTDIVQLEPPYAYCRQIISQLPNYSWMGSRRRKSLTNLIRKIIIDNGILNQDAVDYLSEESFRRLNESVNVTELQIQNSRLYLDNPHENQHLLNQTFRPELHLVAKHDRLYNLVPKPAFTKKYIKFTRMDMNQILRHSNLHQYIINAGNNLWENLLNLNAINGSRNLIFSGYIQTDGFTVSVPFDKRVDGEPLPDLTVDDFEPWELPYLNMWGSDPGGTDIFVASNGSDEVYNELPEDLLDDDEIDEDQNDKKIETNHENGEDQNDNEIEVNHELDEEHEDRFAPHEVRRFSSTEYYCKAGYTKTSQRINESKTQVIKDAESSIRTYKTTSLWRINSFISSTLSVFNTLTTFHGQPEIQGLKFLNYQGRQKVDNDSKYHEPEGNEAQLRRLNNNGRRRRTRRRRRRRRRNVPNVPPDPPDPLIIKRKWEKARNTSNDHLLSVICHGDAIMGRKKILKKGTGLADRYRKLLIKAAKNNKLVHISINEYNTSQVCSKCGRKSLVNIHDTSGHEIHSVLVCTNCHTVWNRDRNASRNMRSIFLSLLYHHHRPQIFQQSS
ncbi:unnamed protein product [Cunninghamella blakesleeana]